MFKCKCNVIIYRVNDERDQLDISSISYSRYDRESVHEKRDCYSCTTKLCTPLLLVLRTNACLTCVAEFIPTSINIRLLIFLDGIRCRRHIPINQPSNPTLCNFHATYHTFHIFIPYLYFSIQSNVIFHHTSFGNR